MTRDQVIELVRFRLGWHMNMSEATILAHMDAVQSMYSGENSSLPLPWFLFHQFQTFIAVAADRSTAMVDDFICFADNWPLAVEDGDGTPHELTRESAIDMLGVTESGRPRWYTFDGSIVYLYPLPDVNYTVRCPCFRRGEALSEDANSDWFVQFPNLIALETADAIMLSGRDAMGRKHIAQPLGDARLGYLRRVESMQHVQRSYYIGTK